ncbi:hypothetical protein [Streptomyces kronopolitis]|uniref:hypothetical protein n=1 Tax=Streptomyces kronopolitis TaxID=1612435 RepID=UPI00341AE9CF
MTSDEIWFDCLQRGDDGVLVIVPRIAGAQLTELIDEFEIGTGMQPAGDPYGPFRFDRRPYDDALRALGAVRGSDAGDTRA